MRGFFLKRSKSYKIMQNVIFHVKLLSPTLKYPIEAPLLITQLLLFRKKGLTHWINSWPNPNLARVAKIKLCKKRIVKEQ